MIRSHIPITRPHAVGTPFARLAGVKPNRCGAGIKRFFLNMYQTKVPLSAAYECGESKR